MKKIILYLLISLSIIRGFSQGLELYYEGTVLNPDAEITLTGYPDSGMIVLDTLDVKNISAVTQQVMCIRTILENIDSTVNSFCWGICYPPFMDTSTTAVTIQPQDFSFEFVGDHDPAGMIGIVKVKYAFYDIHTPLNQTSVIVNYDHSHVNVINNPSGSQFISGAYPNPANHLVSFDYDLTGNPQASILIYNFLGRLVNEYPVGNSIGTLTLDTSGYNEGIYFYTLKVNNEIIKTKKLVIKRS